MNVDSLLQQFQHFGVQLGLERIQQLLADLGNPHHDVPMIHVGGTNGKGSVCAYLSAVLTEAGYRVGRYTSPHLVDWTERICLNEQPIEAATLSQLLEDIQQAIKPERESPTQFEVITAAAWLYFARMQVDIAVMEVGLGGRLDATNVSDHPLVSIITSISREHWQRLGPTLAHIAREKAGILKPSCPAVIGILGPEAQAVVVSRLEELNCPAIWVQPAQKVREGWARYIFNPDISLKPKSIEYPLPLLGEVQLLNSAIAITTFSVLQQQGWTIPETAIQQGMAKTHWLGRLQWLTWQNRRILIDGAHNPAAAQVLRQYVDTLNQPITWVMGMLSTKDHGEILQALLRPGDRLYLVPVPDHSTADPEALANLATTLYPELSQCQTFADVLVALKTAIQDTSDSDRLIVLCGSLYLVGYFLRCESSFGRTF